MISSPNLVPIDGSHRDPLPGAEDVGPASRSQIVTVTVLLKPQIKGPVRNAMSADVRDHQYLTREALEAEEMADPRATARVMRFATESGLTAIEDESGRRVEVSGTVDALNRAFGVQLRTFRTPQVTYRGRTGALNMPAEIAVDVEAVLGLDDRPQVRPGLRLAKSPSLFSGYPPAEIAKLYDFPTTVSGAGQCIGIAEFGGGFDQANLDAYFKAQGIATVEVKVVGVAGGHNQPGVDQNADSEVMLDIEVAHSVAPDAKIVVYFAPNTSRGFVGAVTAAVHDKVNNPSVLSISWGGPEGTAWTTQAINALESVFVDAAKVGLTVLAASGDDRARDYDDDGKVHVNYPASSPSVLGCGGTRISVHAGAIANEVVWNDGQGGGSTGGGVSVLFPVPAYQARSDVPANASTGKAGRGVPDVAADASPVSGYMIRLNGGQVVPIGGTSAVSPLMAGLVALANEHVGKPVGFVNAALYQLDSGFNDIMSGNNDITGRLLGYDASKGWDPCTGLGSPKGTVLVNAL